MASASWVAKWVQLLQPPSGLKQPLPETPGQVSIALTNYDKNGDSLRAHCVRRCNFELGKATVLVENCGLKESLHMKTADWLSVIHASNDKESIHQLQFGVSLGDLWFVKRRQK